MSGWGLSSFRQEIEERATLRSMKPPSLSPNVERFAQALQDDAIRALRRIPQAPESMHPDLYRDAAQALVKLRALHTTRDGRPDWRGQSWDYRQRVNDIYNAAGLPSTPNHPIKSALRYHLGNALRESLSEDELQDAGLHITTPRDRQYARFLKQTGMAEFARSLIYQINVRPKEPAPKETIARAEEIHNLLGKWLRQQRKMRRDRDVSSE